MPSPPPFTIIGSRLNTPRRVALITGAASGLGAAFAESLARDSFDLVLVDRNSDQLHETAERIARNHGVRVHPMVQDLTHPEAVANISRQCDDLKLPIDFLVNNAGHHLNKLMHESNTVARHNIPRIAVGPRAATDAR